MSSEGDAVEESGYRISVYFNVLSGNLEKFVLQGIRGA